MSKENDPPTGPGSRRPRRWSAASSTPTRSRRNVFRLIGIPIVALAAAFLYRGLREHLVLPECDSQRAKETLTEILKQLKLEPERYEPLKTVSSSSTEIVCNAVLPLPGGGNVTIDYTFYWEGNKVNMKYSVSHSAS